MGKLMDLWLIDSAINANACQHLSEQWVNQNALSHNSQYENP